MLSSCLPRPSRLGFAALALLSLLTACTSTRHPPEALAPLLGDIEQRLALATPVALSKWDSGQPVEDRPRERQVIDRAAERAREWQVDPTWARQLFADQIEASKISQHASLDAWKRQGQAPQTPRLNLATQIRPALDDLQERMLQDMAHFAPYRADGACRQWLADRQRQVQGDASYLQAWHQATASLCAR